MHGKGREWQGGACMAGQVCGGGACVAGGHAWQGVVRGRGCELQGVCMAGGMCGRGHARQGGGMRGILSMSEWYTSYWNTFLFVIMSFKTQNHDLCHSQSHS